MKTASFTEFRRHARAFLDLVAAGERVRILRHGTPVADLVPPGATEEPPLWKRPRRKLTLPGTSVAETVLRDREESRR